MDWTEAFLILGIEPTKDERALKNAYREKLAVTNPEDDPEGFRRLRGAYEEACRYAKEPGPIDVAPSGGAVYSGDATPSGIWLERVAEIYRNIRSRQDVAQWRALFNEDVFLSLEEEENCRMKLLRFLASHFRLPTEVWRLLDRRLSIVKDAKALRERFSAGFVNFIVSRCERGEDLEFAHFEGPEEADYDRFLEHYECCCQALNEGRTAEAEGYLREADGMGIRHPVMEICRARIFVQRGRLEEAVALLEGQLAKFPRDEVLSYNFAELLWAHREEAGYRRAAELYLQLKAGNDRHYMANLRLAEWHYGEGRFREAKRCAERVLATGGDDAFMELLTRINAELEKELEAGYRENGSWENGLELCWCYLQDGRIAWGIWLALDLKVLLPLEREAEYHGLMAKLYVEQAQYEDAMAEAERWEEALEGKLALGGLDSEDEERERDRLRQARQIRMQCCHNLGFRDREMFRLAIRAGEEILTGSARDAGVLLEMAQIYMELGEYGQSIEIAQRLLEEHQVMAANASLLEAYRRQLDVRGVVQSAVQCIRYFPSFVKSYEYLAKVYLDLGCREDFERVLEDARKNGVWSVMIEAYQFQQQTPPMDIGTLNGKLKEFRLEYFRRVEEGDEGYYERGLPILTEYLYHLPDDFLLVERGIFHRAAHRLREAKEDFEKALYLNPVNSYALNGLSLTYKYLGDYEKALFYLKKAILYKDKEMSPVIYEDMGDLYALLGLPDMAYEAYLQYGKPEAAAGKGWFYDRLAECAMRMGKVEEAETIYGAFWKKDSMALYRRLAVLYNATGQEEKARQVLRQWERAVSADPMGAVRSVVSAALKKAGSSGFGQKGRAALLAAYYCRRGWTELLYADRASAVRAFDRVLRNSRKEGFLEGKVCEAVFAFALCGDDAKGRKCAELLQKWLAGEGAGGRKYYRRQKDRLRIEFFAAYYEKPAEELWELLGREASCELCQSCTNPICSELEGARLLLLLRTGQREEAQERLLRGLGIQPWDEYLLAVRHIAFGT